MGCNGNTNDSEFPSRTLYRWISLYLLGNSQHNKNREVIPKKIKIEVQDLIYT
ncbi:hypothetical protein VDIAB_100094 [Vibrio diabolicus]|nr:hypothetical protein VDIAB_100094 [Vibrio diabolicus]